MQCQFEYKTIEEGKEVTYVCPEEAEGVTRCKEVCRRHFRKLKQDNLHRIELGEDIPTDTTLKIRDKWVKQRLVKK